MTAVSYLVLSVALFIAMVVVQSMLGVKAHGLGPLAGARDGMNDDNVMSQRAKRANQNMIEGLVMFAPLVLAAAHLGLLNDKTTLGAMLFFWGRLVYAPLYWFGVPWLRTLAWGVSLVGIIIILLQVLPL